MMSNVQNLVSRSPISAKRISLFLVPVLMHMRTNAYALTLLKSMGSSSLDFARMSSYMSSCMACLLMIPLNTVSRR